MAAAEGVSRKLFGYALSSNSVRIAALLNEKGLDYDLVAVDLDNKTPEFLAISPFGQIPAFQDGDDTLFESRAISRHIATKYRTSGPDLLPTPSAKLEVWLEVESQHFYPAVADLVYELRVRPRLPGGGGAPEPGKVGELARKVAAVLDIYDAHLADNKYLAGDQFTLADVNHMAQLFVMSLTPRAAELVAAREHVKAWWDEISARPAWKKTVAALPLPPA
ncbi:glutathione S-transferase 3 [Brachypodium distachyon]|uniref:glutathione transferase n=1 Tax=Brachypodium distachyon TaxID=15368 RepID=I1HUX0_BRADI|nr:glutathione S-transferase 3 [Brachypodium distachyon]KQK11381.1 hypothetical protein BRADI_2g59840v3 [Brachypodium distachyon]|eukprot:XP_003565016.1 glutathione S-transferase 3 [Brachypodium distachyon]